MEENKLHWEHIYGTKQPGEVSWTQQVPQTSLDFIKSFRLPYSGSIIDIGGGDSTLVDKLLEAGYTDITVLDISEKALERARKRLGPKAEKVTWIVSDIVDFLPDRTYDVWHDRAAFHFLTSSRQVSAYLQIAARAVGQYMVLGTFSENGPQKCSGLPIRQYSQAELQSVFARDFRKIKCVTEDHRTPFGTLQNFLFCSFATIR